MIQKHISSQVPSTPTRKRSLVILPGMPSANRRQLLERVKEDVLQRGLHPVFFFQATGDHGREQRVPSKLDEERVVGDMIDLQQLLPVDPQTFLERLAIGDRHVVTHLAEL